MRQHEAWRTYLEVALGVTEGPRRRVRQMLGSLASRGTAGVGRARAAAGDLVAPGRMSKETVARLVRDEVARARQIMGLPDTQELEELRERVAELEERLHEAEQRDVSPAGAAPGAADRGKGAHAAPAEAGQDRPAATRSPAKKAAASTAGAKKAPSKAAPKKASPSRAAAKKAPSKTTQKKTSPSKSAKKTAAKKPAPDQVTDARGQGGESDGREGPTGPPARG